MWDNHTRLSFSDLSRDAFLSLQSDTVIELPLMDSQQKRMKWMERKNKGRKSGVLSKNKANLNNTDSKMAVVNNIKKQENCKAHPFKQRIRIQGCIPKIIKNKFCHGTCTSYFVPRLRPRKLKLRSQFRSCSACTPSDYDVIQVRLECPNLSTKYIIRNVHKIRKCACISVDVPENVEPTNISFFNV